MRIGALDTDLVGADLEEMARLEQLMERQASALATLTSAATTGVTGLDRLWDGPDSSQFRQIWFDRHRPGMRRAVDELRSAAAAIERNRLTQERTSAADGPGAATSSNGPTATQAGIGLPGFDDIGDFLFGDVANFWSGGDDGFPAGSLAAALIRMNRIRGNDLPLFNTGWAGQQVSSFLADRPGALGRAGAWMQTPGADVFFRRVGIVGGVVSTGLGAYDLYQQGNPIDAFHEEGAGYVADVASTAFSASSTAFLIAPNPVTGTVAIATGLVWAGAEVVDHWDDITEWTSDTWDAGADLVSDAWDDGTDALSDAWDAGTGFASDVGGAIASIGDWF